VSGGYTVGIDIGTTGTKAAVLDVDGRIVAVATRAVALASPLPGAAEVDPAHWVRNVVDAIREAVATSGIEPRQVAAIATSGMVPALVLLDEQLRPVRPAFLQNDARATREVDEVASAVSGLDVVALTGSAVTQQSIGPKALWVRRNEPDVWRRVRWIVGSYDSVLIALGAAPHVEQNWAIESGLFTLDGAHLRPALDAALLDTALLPPVLKPGERTGELCAAAAEATGLPVGVPLVVGGADHVLSAYAAGVVNPGDWLIKLGGAGDILAASREPVVDARLYLDAHPVPGNWLPNGCMATSGSLIRWYQTLIGGEDLRQLDIQAERREPASVLCLPYFLGEKSPLHDPDLRGAFVGLHLGHTRADLYRAVLEAIAFGFRHHTEVYRELDIPLNRALITNGGSRSTLWKQIHAEVLGTEVTPVVDHPGASLGAAILAGIGAGQISTEEPISRFSRLSEPVRPDPARISVYDEAYARWRELGHAVAPISHALARRAVR
jgi:xylulokinase